MHITSREREIIHLLLSHQEGITVSEIAEKMKLSGRTIHRELKGVETILTEHEIMLEKKSGIGLFLRGTRENRNELKISLLKQVSDFTAKEREELILLTLLKSRSTTKLAALANDFNVTVKTVSDDLDHVATYLKSFGILLVRKKGHGISLQATEQQKRNVLGYFLSMQFNEYEFLELLKDPDKNENRFLEIIKIEKLTLANKVIGEMVEAYDLQLTDHAHMTLTIHLSLAMGRVAQGEIITIDEALLAELKNDEKFAISKEIAKAIEGVFNIEFPDAELGYITIHLKGARLNASVLNLLGERALSHTESCKSLISYVSRRLKVPFEQDHTVLEGLLKHIEPAVYRLERGINLYNPLTSKIRAEYPKIFEATKSGLKKYFSNPAFTDNEIAYVVLYFGASHILYDTKRETRVVVICPSGLGSSKMLRSRIEKEIEGMTVTTLSLNELETSDLSTFDLILSTVDLAEKLEKYLLISPILSEAEIDRIRKEVKQQAQRTEDILLKRVHEKGKVQACEPNIKERLHHIKRYSELTINLLRILSVHPLSKQERRDEMVAEMLGLMEKNQLISNVQGVQNDLEEREKRGGFAIPETKMAFYHCQTRHVNVPIFQVFRLEKAMEMQAMDKSRGGVTSILVALAPMDASEVELEVLSLISAAVVEDNVSIQIFTEGSKALMEERLSQLFYQKLKTMLT